MKKFIAMVVSVTMITIALTAQDGGMQFQSIANWKEVVNKAKQENKYIFVDCYATWCAPCKMMDKTIFPEKEVGQYFNDKFISVKIQMDKTDADAAFVQSWYKDAKMLADQYAVTAFPTYLIFSPDGAPLHRFTGGSKTPAEFIAKTKNALNPATQYYTAVLAYKTHLNDSAYLRNAIRVALSLSDRKMASAISDHYLKLVNPFIKENLIVLRQTTMTGRNTGYDIVKNNPYKVDSVAGKGVAALITGSVMYEDEIKPYLENGKKLKNWNKLAKKVKRKYPMLKPQRIDLYEILYYQYVKKDIPGFEKVLLAFMDKYGDELDAPGLNEYAWSVFTLSERKEMLEAALKWSERALELVEKTPGSNYCNFMDSHANLLYKLGRKEEAIQWEKDALVVAAKDDKVKLVKAITGNLLKMEKGEKTWE